MILTIMKNRKRNMKFHHSNLKIPQLQFVHLSKLHQSMKLQKLLFCNDLQLYKGGILQNNKTFRIQMKEALLVKNYL